MLSIHLELLSEDQLNVFKKLSFFKRKAVLAGGTALSLQLCHRYSFDFDLFLERPIAAKDLSDLRKIISIKEVIFNSSDMLILNTIQNISISLVYYWYKPIYKTIDAEFLKIFDYRDISFDKAHTIGRRATWRDYFDLFYILKQGLCSVEGIIQGARKKFGVEFSPEQFLTQLCYFDDLKEYNLKFVEKQYEPEEIKTYLTNEVEKFMKKKIVT